ncbi:MAG TPA: ribonuclease J [Terriglobia bacterium]|nr:ribonuclease J [Terriglobia bacterium]
MNNSPVTSGKLRVIPLGGLGEFGMNMMLFEYGEDIMIVDCGVMFPEPELLGVDIVIPDLTYLRERRDRVRAIVLTHGHEDHIGGLPYVLDEVDVPVYGTPFTLALARSRLEEHGMADSVDLREMAPKAPFNVGPFKVEFIHLTHSIIDSGALAISTPLGVVIHTGDFKFDPTPTDGRISDLHTLADYGQKGVLALFSDSTNVERPGMTPSERGVRERFAEIAAEARGRLVFSCFSTSLHRMQIVADLAQEYKRRLCFIGRSMHRNSEIALDMGRLRVAPGVLVTPEELAGMPRDKVMLVVAGSQGEPMSAMARVAVDSHRWVTLEPGDEVVLSARVIPGNEKAIFRMMDHLYRRGAHVHYQDGSQPPVHVSGHGSLEELRLMLNLVRPRYFIPVHGDYRQLARHREVAAEGSAVSGSSFLLEDGAVLEFDSSGARLGGQVTVGHVYIDTGSLEEVGEVILKERRRISEDGIVVPILAINKHTGLLEAPPEIVSRGFVQFEAAPDLLAAARDVVLSTIEKSKPEEAGDWGMIKDKIRSTLRKFFDKELGKRPLILPVVLEV